MGSESRDGSETAEVAIENTGFMKLPVVCSLSQAFFCTNLKLEANKKRAHIRRFKTVIHYERGLERS